MQHYTNAPITEAIIDLKVTLPVGTTLETIQALGDLVQEKFPVQEPCYRSSGELTYKPGESVHIEASMPQIGIWFRSADRLQTFQATLDGFTFNRLAPYESWKQLRADAQWCWNFYKQVCQPIFVTRAAMRYINQIQIPMQELVELKEYLRTVPEVSPLMPQNVLSGFFVQLQLPQQDLDCMLVINEALTSPTNPMFAIVILDFDLFRQQRWESDDEDIWHFLEKLRRRKNEVFEASITEKTRRLIS
jgi:uncharacterized protein (TIGR04255 family)